MRTYLVVITASLMLSWGAWVVVGLSSFDSFDDTLRGWVGFFVIWPGTLCGLLLGGAVCFAGKPGRNCEGKLQKNLAAPELPVSYN